MRLEAECFPLFAGGVALVLAAELLVGLLLLRRRPGLRGALLGHLICLAIAFLCLGKLIFAPADNSAGMASEMNSPIFALFGVFWFLSEVFVVGGLTRISGGPSSSQVPQGQPAADRSREV